MSADSDVLATIRQRALARAVDFSIIGLISLALALPTADTSGDGVDLPLWVGVAITLVFIGYEGGFVAAQGATPGKRLLGIRVVDRQTGGLPSLGRAGVRAAAAAVVLVVTGPFALAAVAALYATAVFDQNTYRGIVDRLAGTAVVRRA